MAREDDMTDGAATSESAATRNARRRAIEGDAPLTADAIGKAVAENLERNRNVPAAPIHLGEIVRASVRAGYEDVKMNDERGRRIVVQPRSITFKASETADGKETTVVHGRPVRLKREAFQRYLASGQVEFG